MTAQGMLGALRRRWYVLAVMFLVTCGGMYAIHKRAVDYQACDLVYVTPPSVHGIPNVWTNENGSLVATAGVATRALMSPATLATLRSSGEMGAIDAEVTNTGSNETPIYSEPTVQICSYSRDPSVAATTTTGATREFSQIVRQLQVAQGAPPQVMITVTIISSSGALPVLGRPSQALLGLLFIGLLAGVTLTLWADPLLTRREHRRGKTLPKEIVTS